MAPSACEGVCMVDWVFTLQTSDVSMALLSSIGMALPTGASFDSMVVPGSSTQMLTVTYELSIEQASNATLIAQRRVQYAAAISSVVGLVGETMPPAASSFNGTDVLAAMASMSGLSKTTIGIIGGCVGGAMLLIIVVIVGVVVWRKHARDHKSAETARATELNADTTAAAATDFSYLSKGKSSRSRRSRRPESNYAALPDMSTMGTLASAAQPDTTTSSVNSLPPPMQAAQQQPQRQSAAFGTSALPPPMMPPRSVRKSSRSHRSKRGLPPPPAPF